MIHNLDFLTLARARADQHPDRVAFVDYDINASRAVGAGVPFEPRSTTHAEFWERSLALAAALREQGVAPGDIVAVQLPNRHEFVTLHLALYAIGAVTMPVSPIYRSLDISRMLAISSARALVVPSSFGSFNHVEMARTVAPELPALRMLIEVGEPSDVEGVHNVAELIEHGHGLSRVRDEIGTGAFLAPANSAILLNFTSGTTGEPKGVLHSRETIASSVIATMDRLRLSEADTGFVAATLGHAGGFLNGIYMPLLGGLRVVFMDVWDPGLALQILTAQRVTYGAMMPPYLVDMTRHADFAKADLASWRVARVSGGVIPRGVMDTLHQRLPQLRLCPGWGMSETLYITCAGPDDPVEKRNVTDGRPVGTCEVQIRDPLDEGRTLPPSTAGHIVVRAPSVMLGYFDRPELTADMTSADGWFKTGDLGVLDSDGYLTIRGRLKDIVLRGGENVPVVEVEMLLMTHPKVKAVSIVGIPDERLGEAVCALVVCDTALTPMEFDEMRTFLADAGLTRQFIPEHLVLCSALPVTAHGKVRRSDARRVAMDALGLAVASDTPLS